MLTLLSQPRQIDNVSRRLKLVQPDLERLSTAGTLPMDPARLSLALNVVNHRAMV